MHADAGPDTAHSRHRGEIALGIGLCVLLLGVVLGLIVSCPPMPALLPPTRTPTPAPPLTPTPTPRLGILDVDNNYAGRWYVETFGYTRDAKNIRHYILVMPEGESGRASAGEIFSGLEFSGDPDAPSLRQERQRYAWALEFLHAAPGGHFRGEFVPGTYQVAVAFIAAPLTREEAGVPDDAILYAGITGGGASTDYRKTVIQPGENTLQFILSDKNGWACPWLYVLGRHGFERRTEILRNLHREASATTETTNIGLVEIIGGAVTVAVAEERDEVTFLDQLVIIADATRVIMDPAADSAIRVANQDGTYLVIANGETWTFRFPLPAAFTGHERATVSVIAAGFYVPAPF